MARGVEATRMVEARITIRHAVGLHARPAALFVQTAQRFASSVSVRNLTRPEASAVDAKSILGILTLGVAHGHEVVITADGVDERQAVESLVTLVEGNFAEAGEA
jgi:phosphotransferase system HPr (HPr) family protein